MPVEALGQAIRRLAAHESLDAELVRLAFGVIMRGEGTAVQVAALALPGAMLEIHPTVEAPA